MTKTTLQIKGMHCASCSTILTRALEKVEGVKTAVVNYSTEKAQVEFDEKKANETILINAVKSKGYGAEVYRDFGKEGAAKKRDLRILRWQVIISALFAVPALMISMFFMELPFRDQILCA